MKKIALIILVAVYGLAIAGAGITPVMVAVQGSCGHADGFAAVNNEGDAGSCGNNETCNTVYTGFTIKEHQHAARQFHFSARHFTKDTEGNLPTAVPPVQPARIFAANNRLPGAAVPAYILHCVYRL